MTQHPDAKIYLVDDDAEVRQALAWLLRTRRLLSEGYDHAEAFQAEAAVWTQAPEAPCCVVLDVRMPGMSGLTLFERMQQLPWKAAVPVIFLSGHADVPTASTPSSAAPSTSARNRFRTTRWSTASSRRWTARRRCWPSSASSASCSSAWTA